MDKDEHRRLNWTVFMLAKQWTVEIASDPNGIPLFLILAGSDGGEHEPSDSATLLEVNSKPEHISDEEKAHGCRAIWNFDSLFQAREEAELRFVLSQINDKISV